MRSASVSGVDGRGGRTPVLAAARRARGKFGSMDEGTTVGVRVVPAQRGRDLALPLVTAPALLSNERERVEETGLAYLQSSDKEEVIEPYASSPTSEYCHPSSSSSTSSAFPPGLYLPSITSLTPPRQAPAPPSLPRLVIPSPTDPLVQTPELRMHGLTLKSASAAEDLMDDYYSTDADANADGDERYKVIRDPTGNDRLRALYGESGGSGICSGSLSAEAGIEAWEKEGLDRGDRLRAVGRKISSSSNDKISVQIPASAPPGLVSSSESSTPSPSLISSATFSATSSFFRAMSIRNKTEQPRFGKGSSSAGPGGKMGYEANLRVDKIRIKVSVVECVRNVCQAGASGTRERWIWRGMG